VDRDRLAVLLDAQDDTYIACRLAVLAGARFWIDDGEVPASRLATIYHRRDRLTRAKGIQSRGFTAAVEALQSHGEEPICIGAVDIDDPPYHFQLFLNANLTAVVACLGVDQRWRAANPPSIRAEVARIVALAPLPPEDDCPDELIMDMDAAITAMPMQVTDTEALALLEVLATPERSSYYGLMWTLIHAIESAPGWPLPQVWSRQGPWIENLRTRARNAGFQPPG
jgi:hypothetical protein